MSNNNFLGSVDSRPMQSFRTKQVYVSGEYGEGLVAFYFAKVERTDVQRTRSDVHEQVKPGAAESRLGVSLYFRDNFWNHIKITVGLVP